MDQAPKHLALNPGILVHDIRRRGKKGWSLSNKAAADRAVAFAWNWVRFNTPPDWAKGFKIKDPTFKTIEWYVDRLKTIGQLECGDPACLSCERHREEAAATIREALHSKDWLILKMAYALEHLEDKIEDEHQRINIRELVEEARR